VVKGKRQVSYQRVSAAPSIPVVPPVMTAGDLAGLNHPDPVGLRSNVALVIDQASSQVLFERIPVALPIASVTKLMTALVVVEAPEHGRNLTVTDDDVDREKHSSSRLRVGATLSRDDMLHIALMSSENRAASALGRNYPGGLPAFVAAMNAKARSLGMTDTRYVDSTGLSSQNVASARDLAKLVVAAYNYPIIRQYSTDPKHGRAQRPRHAVPQLQPPDLQQGVGYRSAEDRLHQRGRPLPGDAHRIEGRPIVMVFLDSKGRLSHVGDAARMRKWLVEDQPTT
jgi:D-alanyl-D-alanine endopeptidase (penicillin-binding protein 7)